MRRWLAADLHLHSVLSPCGDLAMSPSAVVARARAIGLDLIALTDHNCARNAPALAEAARREGLAAWFGVEARTAEEVDVLCLFDEPAAAVAFGEWTYDRLPAVACDAEVFGDQVVVDAEERILGFAEKLLISATSATIEQVCGEARARGGLVIPAHIDRSRDSVISQLGFLPPGLPVDAFEVSRFGDEAALLGQGHDWLATAPVVRFSDAHRLSEIGWQQTRFELARATITAAREALADGAWRVQPVRHARREE